MDNDMTRRVIAEFFGTLWLVLGGCGAAVLAAGVPTAGIGYLGVAFAFGLTVLTMAYAVGHISGGHFNPAVTLGFVITRRIAPTLAVSYWAVQFTGAVAAALLLKWIYPDRITDAAKLGAPTLAPELSVGAGFVVEVILTFFLIWVVFATAADPRGAFALIAGLAIGLTVTADILVGGPLTGAAMNPARAFGPMLVQNVWSDGWIWYLGPFLGGGLAALAYDMLYLTPTLRPAPPTAETGLDEPRPGEASRL